jgi:uncharacterized protein YbaR (Trm112 family)
VRTPLLELIRCPFCRAELREDGDTFRCRGCDRTFDRTADGIPLMLHAGLPGAPAKLREAEGWLEKAEKEDPVRRVQAYLAAQGLWDEATAAAVNSEIHEQVEGAVSAALEMPVARPESIFDHVYVTPPPRVMKQREELINRDA